MSQGSKISSVGGDSTTNSSNPLTIARSTTSERQKNSSVDASLMVASTNPFERAGSVTSTPSQNPSTNNADQHENTVLGDPSATTATIIGRHYFGSLEFSSDFELPQENWPFVEL